MKTNVYGVTLGAACSAMLIFGSNYAFATEYALTEKIKVALKAEITGIVSSTNDTKFAHPDGTSLLRHHVTYGEYNEADKNAHPIAVTELEKLIGEGSKLLRSLNELPSRFLQLGMGADAELVFYANYDEGVDFFARGKFTNILSDHGKHLGSTHDYSFWLKNVMTAGIKTSKFGTFEVGAIDNVFDYVLTAVPVLHREVNKSLNSVPSYLVNTGSVRTNIAGLSWDFQLRDLLHLGATIKPTSGLAGTDQPREENFIEHGMAAEIALGGPELLIRMGAGYMAEFPHNFMKLGLYESFFNSSFIVGSNFSFEFPGWQSGFAYKYRASTSVTAETFEVADPVTAEKVVAKKVENFYFHQLEASLLFVPGETDWVTNEEFRNWSLGAKLTLLIDSSDAEYLAHILPDGDVQHLMMSPDGKDILLTMTLRPYAFQVDLSAKRTFSEAVSVFAGLRLTYDQGVGMFDFYKFEAEGRELKLKEGDDYQPLRPLNKVNCIPYLGISASLR